MNEHISGIINHRFRNHVIVGVVSFIGGGAVGYILGRRTTTVETTIETETLVEFDVREAIEEIAQPKTKREALVLGVDEYEAVVTKGIDFVQGISEEEEEPEPEVVTRNVFAETDEDWDYQEELKKREGVDIYVLHKDEFFADERDFSQLSLTYYAGDDILVDDHDSPIYNKETVVGRLYFGHGSSDPKVVYVRNEKLKCEYEIIKEEGLYSVEILGLSIEENDRAQDIKHSSVLKFRDD